MSYNAITQIDPTLFDDSPNRLIGTFHYYNPFLFTSSSGDSQDTESWGASDESTVDTEFDTVKTWATTNSVPVFLGEFGADNTGGYNYSTGDLNAVSENSTGFADGGPDNTSKLAYLKYPSSNKLIATAKPMTIFFLTLALALSIAIPKR